MSKVSNFRKQHKYKKSLKDDLQCQFCSQSFKQMAYMIGGGELGIKIYCKHTGFGNSKKYYVNPTNTCNLAV